MRKFYDLSSSYHLAIDTNITFPHTVYFDLEQVKLVFKSELIINIIMCRVFGKIYKNSKFIITGNICVMIVLFKIKRLLELITLQSKHFYICSIHTEQTVKAIVYLNQVWWKIFKKSAIKDTESYIWRTRRPSLELRVQSTHSADRRLYACWPMRVSFPSSEGGREGKPHHAALPVT